MGGKKRVPYAADFSWEALQMTEIDLEGLMRESVETRFRKGTSLQDGVSGKLSIDTSYENTSEDHLEVVSSDRTRYEDRPAPRDVSRHKYPHRRL